ncbi:hypothetical protein M3231_15345 [Neobacillus mesonae]|nr:hypothetical protein [Neobacillus mesonae]
MAKLNVTIPVVDVEINGAKYRKVEREAQEGDVIRITDEDAPDYVINGAFYEVDEIDGAGDPQITDEDGDSYDAGGSLSFEVYEKVTKEPEEQTVEYREVEREAKVGEKIKIVRAFFSCGAYQNGDIITVDRCGISGVESNAVVANGNPDGFIKHSEYVVLEPITAEPVPQPAQTERFKVGDYAMVIVDRTTSDQDPISSGARVGDIVEVVESGSSGYRVGLVDVVTHGDDNVLRLSTGTDGNCPFIAVSRVKLIVPVEQRFDRAS